MSYITYGICCIVPPLILKVSELISVSIFPSDLFFKYTPLFDKLLF